MQRTILSLWKVQANNTGHVLVSHQIDRSLHKKYGILWKNVESIWEHLSGGLYLPAEWARAPGHGKSAYIFFKGFLCLAVRASLEHLRSEKSFCTHLPIGYLFYCVINVFFFFHSFEFFILLHYAYETSNVVNFDMSISFTNLYYHI